MFIFHRVGGIHRMGLFILFLYVKFAWIRKKKKRQPPADGGFSSHTDFLVANEAFIKISWSRSMSPQNSYIPKWDVLPSRILPWNSKIRNHDLTATIHPSGVSLGVKTRSAKRSPAEFPLESGLDPFPREHLGQSESDSWVRQWRECEA